MSKLLAFRIQFIEVMTLQEDEHVVTYKIGKTTIEIVPPQLTTEEKNIRIEEIKQIILRLWLSIDSIHIQDSKIMQPMENVSTEEK